MAGECEETKVEGKKGKRNEEEIIKENGSER